MRKPAAFTCFVVLLVATLCDARAAVRGDTQLTAALRADGRLRACACVVKAAWLDESYARVTVDGGRWRALSTAEQKRLGKRALDVAKRVYLREWQTTDVYDELFVVDRRGRAVFHYQP